MGMSFPIHKLRHLVGVEGMGDKGWQGGTYLRSGLFCPYWETTIVIFTQKEGIACQMNWLKWRGNRLDSCLSQVKWLTRRCYIVLQKKSGIKYNLKVPEWFQIGMMMQKFSLHHMAWWFFPHGAYSSWEQPLRWGRWCCPFWGLNFNESKLWVWPARIFVQ